MEEELARRRERIAALRNNGVAATIEPTKVEPKKEEEQNQSLLTGTTVEGMAAWLMEEAQTLGKTTEPTVRPNADLKREWERRCEPLTRETEKAINHLVRERLISKSS